MLFVISVIVGSILAGMGIGGGSIFVLLLNLFNLSEHTVSIVYNLIMFICVGITATISNLKNKNFDKKIFFKLIIFTIIFSIIGVITSKFIDTKNVKLYFNIFILILSIYEIFSSLKNFSKQKI